MHTTVDARERLDDAIQAALDIGESLGYEEAGNGDEALGHTRKVGITTEALILAGAVALGRFGPRSHHVGQLMELLRAVGPGERWTSAASRIAFWALEAYPGMSSHHRLDLKELVGDFSATLDSED
jgi:hypothetical protein